MELDLATLHPGSASPGTAVASVAMRVFLSYRRGDDPFAVGRLRDSLARHFGESEVFLDVLSVRAGAHFEKVIEATIATSDVVLVLIGSQWENASRPSPEVDYVELEAGFALAHGKLVLPVLLGQRPMPTREWMSGALQELGSINAHRIRVDPDFKEDEAELVRFISDSSAGTRGRHKPRPSHRSIALGLLVLVTTSVVALTATFNARNDVSSAPTSRADESFATTLPDLSLPVSVSLLTEAEAAAQLANYVATDRVVALRLTGSWVPQLAASYVGLHFGGTTYDGRTILQVHQALRSAYGALLVSGRDFKYVAAGEPMAEWYFTVVPVAHATREAAQTWCSDRAIPVNECFPQLFPSSVD